jgi:hypothetical protein
MPSLLAYLHNFDFRASIVESIDRGSISSLGFPACSWIEAREKLSRAFFEIKRIEKSRPVP